MEVAAADETSVSSIVYRTVYLSYIVSLKVNKGYAKTPYVTDFR